MPGQIVGEIDTAEVAEPARPNSETKPPVRKRLLRERIFICYRRNDSEDLAGRLHDTLAPVFGEDRLFMDVDSVPLGVNFVEYIEAELERCAAVLVVIGRNWATERDDMGRRRLDVSVDHVRMEIAAALKLGLTTIPVFVGGASMPKPDDLPDDLRPLAFYNGLRLATDYWRPGVNRLVEALSRAMPPGWDRRYPMK